MKFKFIAAAMCGIALAACNDNTPNPDALRGANFVSNQPGANITLTFDANEMMASGRVVNLYHGTYTVDGNKIKFGNMGITMMMGPADAMETEQVYMQFLPTVETYELKDGHLTLKGADGTEIVFEQVETLPDTDADADADAEPAE